MDVPRRYTGIRTIGAILLVLSWVVLAISLIVAFWVLMAGREWPGLRAGGRNWTGFLLLPFGISLFLQWFVIGSVLKLMTELEHNTRVNVAYLERLLEAAQKSSGMAPAAGTAAGSVPAPSTPVPAVPPPPPPPVPAD
ncbi:MAG: hypothetical protein RMN24_02540 [Anaerolineae bacterium]|nr:hypothetical protein [Caldilineales bacterium]MCX7852741.1 hypothetical protein [Caldilineales bacterium]MDW8268021.1 hypothetical protein [Anaerolineae bacterium]